MDWSHIGGYWDRMPERAVLRWASEGDFVQLGEVMFDAIHNGRSLYTAAQRKAWAPEPRRGKAWDARLREQRIIVLEEEGVIGGFMSLAPRGYIAFAYIRPHAQGSGLFRRLYARVEREAVERGERRLWTHASLVAQPAFAAVGFAIVKREQVALGGEAFDRFEMQKDILRSRPVRRRGGARWRKFNACIVRIRLDGATNGDHTPRPSRAIGARETEKADEKHSAL